MTITDVALRTNSPSTMIGEYECDHDEIEKLRTA